MVLSVTSLLKTWSSSLQWFGMYWLYQIPWFFLTKNLTDVKILCLGWRKVEDSGEWSTIYWGVRNVKPQTLVSQTSYPHICQTSYPQNGAYYIPNILVCQAPKMWKKVTKRYNFITKSYNNKPKYPNIWEKVLMDRNVLYIGGLGMFFYTRPQGARLQRGVFDKGS